jgi:hypothetical protein
MDLNIDAADYLSRNIHRQLLCDKIVIHSSMNIKEYNLLAIKPSTTIEMTGTSAKTATLLFQVIAIHMFHHL